MDAASAFKKRGREADGTKKLCMLVTFISEHNESPPVTRAVREDSLPDIVRSLLPGAGSGTVLCDFYTDRHHTKWWDKTLNEEEQDAMMRATSAMRKASNVYAQLMAGELALGWSMLVMRCEGLNLYSSDDAARSSDEVRNIHPIRCEDTRPRTRRPHTRRPHTRPRGPHLTTACVAAFPTAERRQVLHV